MATYGNRTREKQISFQGSSSKGYGNASFAGSRLITETFLQPTIKQRTFLISKIARRKALRAPEQVTPGALSCR
jgi:hypothetical protein